MENTTLVQIKNVSNKDFEHGFDGRIYKVPAGKTVAMLEDAAKHLVAKSTIKWNPEDGTYEQRLWIVLDGEEEPKPVETPAPGSELLDREAMGDKDAKPVEFVNPDAPKLGAGRRR